MKTLILICGLGFVGLMYAGNTTEEKLADALIKANRNVAHAKAKAISKNLNPLTDPGVIKADGRAQIAGRILNAHCIAEGQVAGIRKDDGIWGCVPPPQPPPSPAPPPGTAH